MASCASAVWPERICVRFSRSMPACSDGISSWLHITSLVWRDPPRAVGPDLASNGHGGVEQDGVVDHGGHEPDLGGARARR